MSTVAKSFTAVGVGTNLSVRHKDAFTYSVSGSFTGTVVLERSDTGGAAWQTLATATGSASGTYYVESSGQGDVWFRFRCSAYTSGTIVTSLVDAPAALLTLQNRDGVNVLNVTEDGSFSFGSMAGTAPATGAVGELLSASRLASAAQSVTNNTPANVTAAALSLTPGVYDLVAMVNFLPAATTNVTQLQAGISLTSATLPGSDQLAVQNASGEVKVFQTYAAGVPNGSITLVIPPTRMVVTATTSVYLVSTQFFTVSTMTNYGSIQARRVA